MHTPSTHKPTSLPEHPQNKPPPPSNTKLTHTPEQDKSQHAPPQRTQPSNNFFTQIETAFKKQNDVDAALHHRIGQLEITTQNIDSKLD